MRMVYMRRSKGDSVIDGREIEWDNHDLGPENNPFDLKMSVKAADWPASAPEISEGEVIEVDFLVDSLRMDKRSGKLVPQITVGSVKSVSSLKAVNQ